MGVEKQEWGGTLNFVQDLQVLGVSAKGFVENNFKANEIAVSQQQPSTKFDLTRGLS
jgi:hypothetical protein